MENKRSLEYSYLHRMMYAYYDGEEYLICLVIDSDTAVSVPVTENAFNSFLDCSMSFVDLVTFFSFLCIKYGKDINKK